MRGMSKILLQLLALGLAAAAFVMLVLPYQAHAAPTDKLPEAKQTRAALYLEARDVPGFIAQQGGSRICARGPRPYSLAWPTVSMRWCHWSNCRN